MHTILQHCYSKAPLFHYKTSLVHESPIDSTGLLSDRILLKSNTPESKGMFPRYIHLQSNNLNINITNNDCKWFFFPLRYKYVEILFR